MHIESERWKAYSNQPDSGVILIFGQMFKILQGAKLVWDDRVVQCGFCQHMRRTYCTFSLPVLTLTPTGPTPQLKQSVISASYARNLAELVSVAR